MRRCLLFCALAAFAFQFSIAGAAQRDAKKSPLEGIWLGKLNAGVLKLRLVLNFKKRGDGKLTGTLDSPDQGVKGIGIETIQFEKRTVNLKWKVPKVTFDGRMNKAGNAIDGNWNQGGLSFKIVFKRVKKKPVVRRPQEPKKPFPYKSVDVVFHNKKASVKIAGTLTLPKGNGPHPAVILISGSGPQNRDAMMMGHKPFLLLSDYLTRKGVAVLRYDDRGVGGSTGSTFKSTLEDTAADVLQAVALLKNRKDINGKKIGLIGHSEGGIVAPLVAVKSKDVAYIVMLAGTGLPGEEILYLQGQAIVKSFGGGEKELKLQKKLQQAIFRIVRKEKDFAKAKEHLLNAIDKITSKLDDAVRKAINAKSKQLEGELKKAMSPWFRHFVDYDPRPPLRKLQCPALALIGTLDVQVPPKENLKAIKSLLKESGNKDFTVKEMPKLNHLFQTAQTGSIAEYAAIEETMSPGVLQIVTDWILARIKKS